MVRAICLAVVLLAGCGADDPEAELREIVAAAERAIEAHNTGFFRDLVADSYRDSHGNDRARLIDAIRAFFLTNQRIEAIVLVREIRLDGPVSADVIVDAAVLRETGGPSLLGIDGDLLTIELELLNDGDWQLIGAGWN